jgi:uncharacterized SAM-binding protein YcdF (DUF218 family)
VRKRRLRRGAASRVAILRPKPKWVLRVVLGAVAVGLGIVGWAVLARHFARRANARLGRFDAIIVLGSKADSDGNPTPRMLSRVMEAVHEYEIGVAPRLILTGGPSRKPFVEAQVMARVAESEGIPKSAIFIEPAAMDTIENACYAGRIMKAHKWGSAEVVSNDYQLTRAAMIFERLPIKWKMQTAPPLEPNSSFSSAVNETLETLKTVRYLTYAQWAERCEP